MSTTQKRPAVAIDPGGLAQIGPSRFQMRGIRLVEGEAGSAPAAPLAPAAPSAPAAPAAAAPTPPAPAAPSAPAPPPAAQSSAPVAYHGDPDAYVRQLRDENKERREALTTERQAHEASKTALATAESERDAARRELAVLRIAPAVGANPAALLDSTTFLTAIANVDLQNEDAVKAAITDALEKNSALKAAPTLPATNGGGARGGSTATPTTLEGAIAAALAG
ncbi:hypothetical protein [Microbacterium sp. GXS0129]|uniref:hypothetical protein n=1 Tax=Microbacterium sp. GXS0129 TaxID=3377836 RepID=UPI003839D767